MEDSIDHSHKIEKSDLFQFIWSKFDDFSGIFCKVSAENENIEGNRISIFGPKTWLFYDWNITSEYRRKSLNCGQFSERVYFIQMKEFTPKLDFFYDQMRSNNAVLFFGIDK